MGHGGCRPDVGDGLHPRSSTRVRCFVEERLETTPQRRLRQLGRRRGKRLATLPLLVTPLMMLDVHTQYGLIGSTEWAEDFADWIQGHAVAYVNVGQ